MMTMTVARMQGISSSSFRSVHLARHISIKLYSTFNINEVGLKQCRIDSVQSNTCMSYRKDIT